MRMVLKLATVATVIGCCLALANPALAGIVNYADVAGEHVMFQGLMESSTMSGPLFGQPAASADTLIAAGSGFVSGSAGGGIDLVDGRLQLTIAAHPGYEFDRIDFSQLGSFFGFGAGAQSAFNSLAIVESNGLSYTGGASMSHSGPGQGSWSGNYSISFPTTDQVTLTLTHQLLTASGLNDAAFTDNSSIRLSVNAFAATSVPEPTTAIVPLLAALALAGVRCRGRRSL